MPRARTSRPAPLRKKDRTGAHPAREAWLREEWKRLDKLASDQELFDSMAAAWIAYDTRVRGEVDAFLKLVGLQE